MSQALIDAPSGPDDVDDAPPARDRRPRRTGTKLLAVMTAWIVGYLALEGRWTRELGFQDTTDLHQRLNRVRDWIQLEGGDTWFFGTVLGTIGDGLNATFTFLAELVSVPASPRPVPEVGWLGVVAVLAWTAYVVAGRWSVLLVVLSLLAFGVFGLWSIAMDSLVITVMSVGLCLMVGVPMGILMARRRAVSTALTPLLDLMQTFPAFCYLAPFALFFGIGPSAAVMLTVVYALPPLVRITEHAIRSVPAVTIEAARSLGLTDQQMLRQVRLPMARRTIVVGINQCTMAALAMATIAALVNGPGLGRPVVAALQTQNVGAASVAGLAIVLLAIMLDRVTTATSERAAGRAPRRFPRRTRRIVSGLLLLPVVVAVWLSRRQFDLAEFPDVSDVPVLGEFSGPALAMRINEITDAVVGRVDLATIAIKDFVTTWWINPLQDLMAGSPWWLMAAVLVVISYVVGGWRPALITVSCEAVILGTGLWNDSMVTLSMTLIATALVMAVAVVLGVCMGRSTRADTLARPFLDAFQVIPPFVYLVPALALFLPGRFTAIIAATAYAVPIATKLVADGIRGVAPTTVEAARAAGSTPWQVITKVQLPMARESLVLATNQGLLYVLSMVVIGGMVGGGSLGYIVTSGFSQDELFGKGLAAGISIAALGVMLDRTARHAAARHSR